MERLDRIDRILEENAMTMAELQKSQTETDIQMKETNRKLKKVGRQLGEIGHCSGYAAGEFFYNALTKINF